MKIVFILFCAVIFTLSLRGLPGNPNINELNTSIWIDDGPFELSPERGRYALLYSIMEDNSFQFSIPVAKFALPDVAFVNGKYVSLFAPGVSLFVIPGYLIGKYFGAAQVGSFTVISLAAIANALLLYSISIKLGAKKVPAILAGIIFLFATPAFTYAVSLYQHHLSTFLILFCIYILLKRKKILFLGVIWFLFAASILVDYPNLFLMAPIIVYLINSFAFIKWAENGLKLGLRIKEFLSPVSLVFPILLFLIFNQISYDNPFQLSGTLKTVKDLQKEVLIPQSENLLAAEFDQELFTDKNRYDLIEKNSTKEKTALKFFKTRDLLNGFYIHFISKDRGIVFYTPVILFGFWGIFIALKTKVVKSTLLISILAVNILLYSLWGDPWGGWAFGSRYLIPSYAILSIFIAILLTYWKKTIFFWLFFMVILIYSVSVNSLGAITSSTLPPQVEILSLEKQTHVKQEYTYTKNLRYLEDNHSKAFFFQAFAHNYLNAWQYYLMIVSLVTLFGASLIFIHLKGKDGRNNG